MLVDGDSLIYPSRSSEVCLSHGSLGRRPSEDRETFIGMLSLHYPLERSVGIQHPGLDWSPCKPHSISLRGRKL